MVQNFTDDLPDKCKPKTKTKNKTCHLLVVYEVWKTCCDCDDEENNTLLHSYRLSVYMILTSVVGDSEELVMPQPN